MKKSLKIAFCGIVSALVCVIMTASLFPDLTFAVPAVAGLMFIPVFASAGAPAAFACFVSSSVLSFFIGDKTSWLLFLAFFGYYPVLKPLIEKVKRTAVRWAFKFLVFNAAATVLYFVELLVFNISVGKWWLALIFAAGNAVFVLYDIAVSRVAAFYYLRLHKKISAVLNKNV